MKFASLMLCTLLLACRVGAESRGGYQSAYAPGRITRTTDGWYVTLGKTRTFVSDTRVGEPPAEIAPIVALFPGERAESRAWGWVLFTKQGRVEIFRSSDGFTVTTPHETFYALRRGGEFRLSPGRPGVREIPPEDAYFDRRKETR